MSQDKVSLPASKERLQKFQASHKQEEYFPDPNLEVEPPKHHRHIRKVSAVALEELKTKCCFKVRLIQARNLIAADKNGKSDPYCIVTWEAAPRPYTAKVETTKAKKKKSKVKLATKFQTKTIRKTLSPSWNEEFTFYVEAPIRAADVVSVMVYDWDAMDEHEFLGSAHIHTSDLIPGKENTGWYTLHSVDHGEIFLGITALNFTSGTVDPNRSIAHIEIAAKASRDKSKSKPRRAKKKPKE